MDDGRWKNDERLICFFVRHSSEVYPPSEGGRPSSIGHLSKLCERTNWIFAAEDAAKEGAVSTRQLCYHIPEELRPVALRPTFSSGLPFTSNKIVAPLSHEDTKDYNRWPPAR